MSKSWTRIATTIISLTAFACGGEGPAPEAPVESEAPDAVVEAPSEEQAAPVEASEAAQPASDDETATTEGDAAAGDESPGESVAAQTAEAEPAPQRDPLPPRPEYPEEAPSFERPEHVRGLYLNAWASGSRRKVRNLLASVEGTEINAFVLDIKDATGYVSHRSSVPLVTEIGADKDRRIGNLHALLWQLKEAGIYPIARIVLMKDPRLTGTFPDLAVQDTAGGPWIDGKDQVWVNPYKKEVWDYHIALAREVAEAGFPEIQWDYVRFPDAPRSEIERTTYPDQNGRTRAQAIREGLAYTRESLADLDVEITADVFGVTTSASRDVGIGQVWEDFIDVIDVALPMVYPSHYWRGSFGYETPNAYPYEIVYEALIRAQNRTAAVDGAGTVRPWLQDFTLGPPRYGPEHVRAQIQATYDVGIDEWILWNPGSRYKTEAWAPVGGWAEGQEPMIPVADSMVVESRAMAFLTELREAEAAAKAAEEAEAAAAEAAEAEAEAIGAGASEMPTDTTRTTGN